jgi:glycogen debranching enzyme
VPKWTLWRRAGCAYPAGAVLLATSAVLVTGTQSAAQAEPTRPALTFSNPHVQAVLGRAYTAALTNLLDVNTVTYDPEKYNQTGLLADPPGTFIRAGGGYAQPWTRDAALNSWNAASLLNPVVARNTLWSVVRREGSGELMVQQDDQWWDQVIWLTAAWHHYAVTGDRTFLTDAYKTAANTLRVRWSQNYNKTYGLFGGGSFFNDGIAGYPAPPADEMESRGSFVGSYPQTNAMMALSTNAVYYDAYRSAARMATALGLRAEASAYTTMAASLKDKINRHLWMPGKGTYGYFVHGAGDLAGTVDPSEEGTGLSFAILFGIADAGMARSIMQNTHVQPNGIVDVYPHFARYSDERPGRHNGTVWPMVQGMWAHAAARAGDQKRFATEVATLAKLANGSNGFYEIYNARTGAVDGGWQAGRQWQSKPEQTWSATAYLRMIYAGLFGMDYTEAGMRFAPTLPVGWGDVSLSGVRYRNMTLNISLRGSGSTISSFSIDGRPTGSRSVPATLTGAHTVQIMLTNGVNGDRDADGVADAQDTCPDEAGTAAHRGCPAVTTNIEAENARLTGEAQINSNHSGYSGTGFVAGYGTRDAATTFTIITAKAGRHTLALRYANATGSVRTLSLYVNGVRSRQIVLQPLADWETWNVHTETVDLGLGSNTVSYRYDSTDTGRVNLDALAISPVEA